MNNVVPLARYKKVLLIDDDELDTYIARRIIISELFAREVILKSSVEDALKYLIGCVNEPDSLPEIIFLDLNMPGADGFDFLDAIKTISINSTINLRVVILTNVISSFKNESQKSKNYPMVEAIIEKPLTAELLANL